MLVNFAVFKRSYPNGTVVNRRSGRRGIFLSTTTTMDPPLAPPVRIQAISSTPITTKAVRKSVEIFLDDFQSRTTSAQGGNTAVTVQLQKLANALKEERKLKREKDKKTQL